MLNVLDMNQSEAAREVGFHRSQVSKFAQVLTGYGEIKEYFVQDEIGVTAAYELNKVPDRDRAVHIAKTAVNEGYVDKDIIAQAQWARSDDDGENTMKGAGSETQTRNMQQVKKNAKEMRDLEGIDQEGVRDAQVAPDAEQPTGEGETPEQPQEPQGPPCVGCGEPTQQGPVLHCKFHPRVAEKVGVQDLGFGACCLPDFVEWWQQTQEQAGLEDEAEGEA